MVICEACGAEVERYANKRKCRDCYNAYMREYMLRRYRRRREQGFSIIGRKCVDCGSTENLEFDHVDRGQKTHDVAKIFSYRNEVFLTEVRKCVPRCHACHKARTSEQMSVEHGGGVSGRRACPCQLCKEKKREYMRAWKANRTNQDH